MLTSRIHEAKHILVVKYVLDKKIYFSEKIGFGFDSHRLTIFSCLIISLLNHCELDGTREGPELHGVMVTA